MSNLTENKGFNFEKDLNEYIAQGNAIALIFDGDKIKFRHLQPNKHE